MTALEFIQDHRTALGKLELGAFLVLPWERTEDHDSWCEDLVVLGIEMGVDVWREQMPEKSLTVIFNEKAMPSIDAIQAAIARIEHDRFMNRELGQLFVAGVQLR